MSGRSVLAGRACVGSGTPPCWNPCWLVDPSRLKSTSLPTPRDGGRSHESDASATHVCVGGLRRQNTELQNEQTASSERHCGTQTGSPRCSIAWDAGNRDSVWTRVCWRSQATSQVRKTRGETGAQCSRGTLAQRYHVCRS